MPSGQWMRDIVFGAGGGMVREREGERGERVAEASCVLGFGACEEKESESSTEATSRSQGREHHKEEAIKKAWVASECWRELTQGWRNERKPFVYTGDPFDRLVPSLPPEETRRRYEVELSEVERDWVADRALSKAL